MSKYLSSSILFILCLAFPLHAAEEKKPAAAKPDAAAIIAKEFETFNTSYKEVESKFRTETELPALEKYKQALAIFIEQAEKVNNPPQLAAARKEKERLTSENNVPDPYPSGLPLPMKQIQYKYHKFMQNPRIEHCGKLQEHLQSHMKRMDMLLELLLKREDVQTAVKVEDEIKRAKKELLRLAEVKKKLLALAPPKYEAPAFVAKRLNTPPALEKNLAAYYLFDNDQGDVVVDQTKNKNNATLNKAKLLKEGKFGSCYEFEGSQYIDTGKLLITSASGWTFAAWLKPASTAEGMVFFNGDYGHNGFGLSWFKGRWLVVLGASGDQGGGFGIMKEWQHVLVTCIDGQVKEYLNGRLANSFKANPKPPAGRTIIGSCIMRENINSDWFKGCIDEVMFFNRGLTMQEVNSVYECQGGEPVPEEEKEKPPAPATKTPQGPKGPNQKKR